MTSPHMKASRNLRSVALTAFLGGGALMLSACASVPTSKMGGGPQSASDFEVASIGGGQGEWPAVQWWQSYADPQLTALIEEALAGAPDMRVAEARLRSALAGAQMSKGNLLPSIGGTASTQLQRQSGNLGFPLPTGWDDNGRATLDMNWEVDFWGKNRASYAAAVSAAKAAEAERAHAALAISTAIASDYARLAGLYADQDAAQEAVKVRGRTLELMSERQRNGLENQGAVERAKSARAQAEGELLAVEEGIALLRYRIAAMMGKGPDRGASISRPSAVGRGNADLPENMPAELLGRRPDIVAARERIEAASKRIDVAERSFYPNVNLSAFIGLSSLNLSNFLQSKSLIGAAGPAVSLPIFQGGKLRAQYRMSEADYDMAVAQYDAAVAHAFGEVASAVNSMATLEKRLAHAREAYRAAEAAWTISGNRYRGGLASYLDVLAAEDALITTRRAQASLETRALTLDIDLIRALGGGKSI